MGPFNQRYSSILLISLILVNIFVEGTSGPSPSLETKKRQEVYSVAKGILVSDTEGPFRYRSPYRDPPSKGSRTTTPLRQEKPLEECTTAVESSAEFINGPLKTTATAVIDDRSIDTATDDQSEIKPRKPLRPPSDGKSIKKLPIIEEDDLKKPQLTQGKQITEQDQKQQVSPPGLKPPVEQDSTITQVETSVDQEENADGGSTTNIYGDNPTVQRKEFVPSSTFKTVEEKKRRPSLKIQTSQEEQQELKEPQEQQEQKPKTVSGPLTPTDMEVANTFGFNMVKPLSRNNVAPSHNRPVIPTALEYFNESADEEVSGLPGMTSSDVMQMVKEKRESRNRSRNKSRNSDIDAKRSNSALLLKINQRKSVTPSKPEGPRPVTSFRPVTPEKTEGSVSSNGSTSPETIVSTASKSKLKTRSKSKSGSKPGFKPRTYTLNLEPVKKSRSKQISPKKFKSPKSKKLSEVIAQTDGEGSVDSSITDDIEEKWREQQLKRLQEEESETSENGVEKPATDNTRIITPTEHEVEEETIDETDNQVVPVNKVVTGVTDEIVKSDTTIETDALVTTKSDTDKDHVEGKVTDTNVTTTVDLSGTTVDSSDASDIETVDSDTSDVDTVDSEISDVDADVDSVDDPENEKRKLLLIRMQIILLLCAAITFLSILFYSIYYINLIRKIYAKELVSK